jgi:hypothetical protein
VEVTYEKPEMREMGEFLDGLSKKRREHNREYGVSMLKKCGVTFSEHNNGFHLVVRHNGMVLDYWPSTGKWRLRGDKSTVVFNERKGDTVNLTPTLRQGRGIRNLLAALHVAVPVT